MRSYIILGIYSLVFAAFLKWEASIFVLMFSLLMEVLILLIGLLLTDSKRNANDDTDPVQIGIALIPLVLFYYGMTYLMGRFYSEFPVSSPHGWKEPFIEFWLPLTIMAVSLSVTYYIHTRSIRSSPARFENLKAELIRTMFVIYGSTMAGCLFVLAMPETSKWIPLSLVIISRMLVEIWYVWKSKHQD